MMNAEFDGSKELSIVFDASFPDLMNQLSKYVALNINGMDSRLYKFNLTRSDELSFKININYSVPYTNFPKVLVKFSLPLTLEYHPTHYLTKTELTIVSKSYFNLSESQRNQYLSAAKASSYLNIVFNIFLFSANIFLFDSLFSYRLYLNYATIGYFK